MGTLYVALGKSALLTLTDLPEPAFPGARHTKDYDKVWQIEGIEYAHEAVRSVVAHIDGGYLGADITVTRIYPPEPTADERLESARNVLRADYWSDVRGVCEDIKKEIADRELTDQDDVTRYMDDSISADRRTMLTHSAIECLYFTRNDGAYFETFGTESAEDIASEDGIRYETLAYWAYRADIEDELGDVQRLLEEAAPDECTECGEELTGSVEGDLCDDCEADQVGADNE